MPYQCFQCFDLELKVNLPNGQSNSQVGNELAGITD